jgi:CubicO group peptidase (beta-lactamase class C family)
LWGRKVGRKIEIKTNQKRKNKLPPQNQLIMKKIFLLLLLPIAVSAQKNYTKLLDQYMQAQMNVKGFNGVVLVMQHDKILLKKAYGPADREWNIQNTANTKFRIGSITKQFTASCILQLIEQGKLSLDDKLSKFIPGFPKGDSVTIHMLLNHTSGIPSFTELKDFGSYERLSLTKDSMIRYFETRPYDFSPGTKWQYNNSGYFLLAYILEKTTGQSYENYLRQNIFDKLGMNNTGVDRLDSVLPMRARGYSKQKNKIINAEFISMEWPFGGGVLYSTVDDLYKWDRALYGTGIISNSSKQKMFTPGKSNYGYAMIIDSLENHPRTWHNGSIPGFQSNISRYVNDDACIIVLSNMAISLSNTLPITDVVADGLADIIFDLPYETPYVHKEVKIDPALLDRYVGKYKAFLTLEVIKKDGKLYRHREGSADIELKPESNTKFFYADDSNRQLEFEVDKTGKVVKTWFINNEQRGEMTKVN